jgi:hypothetical protein
MSHRGRVEIEEADQDFADNARANRPEPIATAPNISLPLDVVPERRLAAPTSLRSADFVTGQRCFIEATRDRLARGKSDTLSPFEIADGKGVELLDVGLTRQCDRKSDERTDQTAINLLVRSVRALDPWLLITSSGIVMISVIAALSGVSMAECLVVLMLAPAVTVIGYEVLGYRHYLGFPAGISGLDLNVFREGVGPTCVPYR